MSHPVITSESTLTDRYQTTVPDVVRKVLKLNKREKIRYTIQADGQVLLSRANQEDPALGPFLSLLEKDIQSNPNRLQAATPELASSIQKLVEGVDVDLEVPLDEEE